MVLLNNKTSVKRLQRGIERVYTLCKYLRYEVTIGYNEPILDIHRNEDRSFTCEFVDLTESIFSPDTICDVTVMDNTLEMSSLDDILNLFKQPKYHTVIGEAESSAFFQVFSGDPVVPDDFNSYSLDDLVLHLKYSLFGTLSKPKKMTLNDVYKEYCK